MNRVRSDGMRSWMDGHSKFQRHKRRLERNGWVKVIVGKWWNEASLSSTFNYFKIAIISSCTNPGPHEIIHHFNPGQNLSRHITKIPTFLHSSWQKYLPLQIKRPFPPSPIAMLFTVTQEMHMGWGGVTLFCFDKMVEWHKIERYMETSQQFCPGL